MLKKISIKLLGKKLSCKLGIHEWKVIKSILLSNLIFLIKKHSELLNKVNYKINSDYVIYDRECKHCGKKDLNINDTRKILIQHMTDMIQNNNK